MNDPERPPLDRCVLEQIEMLLDRVDQEHWPMIAAFQVSPAVLKKRPLPPPKTPATLLSTIQTYASMLFKREADQYENFRKENNYAPWLSKVEDRVIARIFRTIKAMEQANQPATLAYHGLTDDEIMQGLGEILWGIRSNYIWRDNSLQPQPPEPQTKDTANAKPELLRSVSKRLSSTVHSPSAAKKVEAYMNARGMSQTEFAIQAGTTDKTIRKFRQTGTIRRSLLAGIAGAMRTTKEELLKS